MLNSNKKQFNISLHSNQLNLFLDLDRDENLFSAKRASPLLLLMVTLP